MAASGLEGLFLEVNVEQLGQTQKKFAEIMAKFKGDKHLSVIVGYSADHAVYVHEIGPPARNYQQGKSHKFLERPARTERKAMIDIIVKVIQSKGSSFRRALVQAGNHLKKKSQEIVPVDTGELRDSAFVHVQD